MSEDSTVVCCTRAHMMSHSGTHDESWRTDKRRAMLLSKPCDVSEIAFVCCGWLMQTHMNKHESVLSRVAANCLVGSNT